MRRGRQAEQQVEIRTAQELGLFEVGSPQQDLPKPLTHAAALGLQALAQGFDGLGKKAQPKMRAPL